MSAPERSAGGAPAALPPAERSDAAPSLARRVVMHVAVLAALAVLVTLGTWQVERLYWKQEIIDRVESRIAAPPAPIETVERLHDETGDVDYRPATVEGRFLHAGERYFLSTFEGQAGWNVYVPMVLAGGSDVLFVNRGFVPYDRKDPATRREGQVEGAVHVTGLARNAPREKGNWFLPDNDPGRNAFFWANIPDMAAGLDLPAGARILPFLLDAGPGAAPGGWPVGGTTIVAIPNNHLQYAITWYGLAAALAAMYGAFLLRGRGAGAPPP